MSYTLASTKTAPQPPRTLGPLALRAQVEHDALVPGTRLDEFEIVRVLGVGGFGIVYLAFDHVLERQVAIKEYMPSALAGRGDGAELAMRSPAMAETFARGLESFFNEARLLACFDHPSLVKVHRCCKAHGTAYMVMQYYPGITLKQARRGMAAHPDGAWLRAFVEPLLDVLEPLHAQGVFHRDIAPDNILLLPDGRPVLLDFGSARRVVADATQALTAVLKPNFAPVEQYADVAGMRQGPWTDLYALGATVHFMLTGEAPVPAVLRSVRDVLPALSAADGTAFVGVPARFLAAIDWSMALSPDDRPQSVDDFRQALDGRVVPPAPPTRQRPESRHSSRHVGGMHTVDAAASFDHSAMDAADVIVPLASSRAAGDPAPRLRSTRIVLALAALAAIAAVGWNLVAPNAAVSAATTAGEPAVAAGAPGRALAAPELEALVVPASAAARGSASPPVAAPAAAAAAVSRPRPAARQAAATTAPSVPRAAPPGAVPSSPKLVCGDLNYFALAICMSRECRDPRWRAHPECAQAHAIEEQRQRFKDQY